MKDVIDTICSGLVYLLGKQNAKGQWLDFNLPQRPREIWVTAYVGYSLTYVAKVVSDDGLRESLSKASDWIVNNMNNDFGWGYNSRTETDADSTGYSIMFLASLGRQVDDGSFNRLMDFQKDDGGFCTYVAGDERNSWGDSHPEVTPVALMALLNKIKPDNIVVRKGAEYVLENRGADGLWQSFWTNTFLYSTAANLKFLRRIGKQVTAASFRIPRIEVKSGFELSLAGECLTAVDYPQAKVLLDEVASRLMSLQQQDGSWRESPIVRLTSTGSHKPWMEADSGLLYIDWNRVFTTATVLRFLAQYRGLS